MGLFGERFGFGNMFGKNSPDKNRAQKTLTPAESAAEDDRMFGQILEEIKLLLDLQGQQSGFNEAAGGKGAMIDNQIKLLKDKFNNKGLGLENLASYLGSHGIGQYDIDYIFIEIFGINRETVERLSKLA